MGGGLLAALPRGGLDEASWRRRHQLLLGALVASAAVPVAVGALSGATVVVIAAATAVPLLGALLGRVLPGRRAGLTAVTLGAVGACVALVALSGGAPAAWSSFFVVAAALAVYAHWLPQAAVLAGAALAQPLAAAPTAAAVQLVALLLASGAVLALLAQHERDRVRRDHREATAALLLDLARRHAGLPARQLDILRDLAATEPDPWVFGELARLDVLAARQWRDAESLLVLSGRRADREPGGPVGLRDLVGAAVAEIEHRDRVEVHLDDRLRVVDRAIPDLTHLLAELLENATRCSPPGSVVEVAARPHGWRTGAHQLVVTDLGAGMEDDALVAANRLLAGTGDDVAGPGVGLRVVARLAARHRVEVALRPGSARGLVAVVVLPGEVLAPGSPTPAPAPTPAPTPAPVPAAPPAATAPAVVPEPARPEPRAAPASPPPPTSAPTAPTVVPPPPPTEPVERDEPVTAPIPVVGPAPVPVPEPEPVPLVHPSVVPSPRVGDDTANGVDAQEEPDEPDVVIPSQVRRSTPLVVPPTVPAPPEPEARA